MHISITKEGQNQRHRVSFDGLDVGYTYIFNFNDDKEHRIHIDYEKIFKITDCKIKALRNNIRSIHLPFYVKDHSKIETYNDYYDVTIALISHHEVNPVCYLEIQADVENWNRPFSLTQLIDCVEEICDQYDDISLHLEDDEIINNGFGIECTQISEDNTLLEAYNILLERFSQVYDKAIEKLLQASRGSSVTSVYNFPKEVRSACEQYLLYFSKFLEDMGINATASIECDTVRTLFSVTPDDPSQALSQIRDALNVFLSLPGTPQIENISTNYNDISVQQLMSNIYHLKSQLVLAQATTQAKDTIIQNLNIINYQNKQFIESQKPKNNEEEVLGGVIKVTEYKLNGFTIDLVKILKMLKRKL